MRFTSTAQRSSPVTLSRALRDGLAGDGGLYVPQAWPRIAPQASPADLPALALEVLAPFAADDVLQGLLPAITREAFSFPAPLVPLDESRRLAVLELFHGPTAAFKDFGARLLAAALSRLLALDAGSDTRGEAIRPLKILVATSGDTGGAVAAAFHGRAGVEVAVLFPRGRVSPTQERQLTCWDGNVRSFAVEGGFDDCQRLVKQAFADPGLRARFELSSANSINLGRLLPQMVYYWSAALETQRRYGQAASFIIPSGNLGNATACAWARRLGAPIDAIVLAHNANRTVPDYLSSGTLSVRASVPTISSAMDVGDPSNLSRLSALFGPVQGLRAALSAVSIDDAATRERIRVDYRRYARVWCPHSAVAAEAYARLSSAEAARGPWVLVATAHPAKFPEIVEPLIGRPVEVPSSLGELLERPVSCTRIAASLAALEGAL